MAKKIVVDNTKVPRNTISGAGKGPNSATVASVMMNDSDLISSPRTKTGMKEKDIEDDLQIEEGDVVDAEQVVSDSVSADSEYQILLAQADVTLPPNASSPDVTRGEEGAGFFSSQSANWWVAGTGVVIAGAGVGFALSSDNGDSGVTVTPNEAPVITTGGTGNVAENAAVSTVIYDAAATDADAGTTITYSLKAATGDVAALDINASTGEVTLKVSADFETKTSYSFTVVASDGTNSSEQAVIVNVSNLDEVAPSITSGVTATAIDENSGAGQVIYTAVADDSADISAGVSFSLKVGSDAGLTISATTGAVTLSGDPNYEVKSSYSFTVVADDGVNTPTEQLVTLAINDLNEAPVINSPNSGNSVSMSVDEGIATVADVDATDVDAGQTITYSLGGGDSELFTINPGTGAVAFASAPDYETALDDGGDNTYNFTVIATDSGTGSLTDTQDFVVSVNDLTTEPPIFSSGATGSVDENDLISTVIYNAATDIVEGSGLTYSLSGPDAGLVNIDVTTGSVTLNASADYETKASYSFTVIANNSGAISEQPVIITVNDINEAPTTTAVTLTILEDSGPRIITQAELLANASDVDSPSLTATNLAISSGGGTLVDNGNGTWTYAPALNDDTAVSFSYTVSDGTPLTAAGNATLDITPVNDTPVITSNGGGDTASISVAENRTAVTTVTVTDVDAGDTQTYSIAGDDKDLFEIDSNGVLTFKVAPDFENPGDSDLDNVYDVQVTVNDGSLTDVQDIAVSVTNYKNVVVESSGAYIDLNANGLKEAGETILADFTPDTGNVDLVLNPVTIHFNDAPNNPLILTGFGSDDLIEIDAQAFIDNGHNLLNILALPGIKFLDDFSPYTYTSGSPNSNPTSMVYNTYTSINTGAGTSYANKNLYSGVFGTLTAKIGLRLLDQNTATRTLLFFSASQSTGPNNTVLASGLPTDMPLQEVVDFVNLPVQSAIIHVVVDSVGAVIDINGDGVRDIGENRLANFDTDGNADLAGKSVVIQFNDMPNIPLDLTGFGNDDLIEIDAQALYANGYQGAALFAHPDAKNLDAYDAYDSALMVAPTANGFSQKLFFSGATEYYYLWNPPSGFQLWYGQGNGNLSFTTYNITSRQLASNLLPTNLTGWSPLQDMVDFVNLPRDLQIVVDQRGAFFDANANGIVDGDEWSNPADFDPTFGNVFVGYNHVTVHYNDVPNSDINLSGFGADDLIEIDAQAFIDNGHNALQILTLTNVITLDGFTANGSFPAPPTSPTVSNWRFSSSYGNSHLRQTGYTTFGDPMNRWVNQGLYTSSNRLNFYSNNGSSSNSWQLATQLPSGVQLQQMVDYVNLPVALDPVHVVVDQNGAVIDFDGDGVRDNGENWLADFGLGGNADLAGNSVVIHFNDIPMSALNLTGFGTDDKIEIDTGDSWLANFGVGASSINYQLAHYSGTATIANTTIRVNQISNLITVTGSSSGIIAYWTDAGNALNNPANLLTDFNGTNNTTVLANLNANHYPGLVEFIWPVNVVVESEGAFIDVNANGMRDGGEDTLALLGQTQADVDAFNTAAGTSYGSQTVDLASEQVNIHYNDLPVGAWIPDLTGFNGDDKIAIDVDAMRLGSAKSILSQNSSSAGSWTDNVGLTGASISLGVSYSYSAVFLNGSKLLFGHTDSGYYTANVPNEGTIASNATALAGHYQQQVVFVMDPSPII